MCSPLIAMFSPSSFYYCCHTSVMLFSVVFLLNSVTGFQLRSLKLTTSAGLLFQNALLRTTITVVEFHNVSNIRICGIFRFTNYNHCENFIYHKVFHYQDLWFLEVIIFRSITAIVMLWCITVVAVHNNVSWNTLSVVFPGFFVLISFYLYLFK